MYQSFEDENGDEYGSFEVFEVLDSQAALAGDFGSDQMERSANDPGFYWWACFPGCIPDGDACGPFDTEDEAIADALA